MMLIRATALIGVGLMWPATAPSRQDREHAARATRQTPEHHLQEAGRALERAWRRADSAERRQLGPLRTDFAQLVIAYSRIPVDAKAADAGRSSEPGRTAGSAAQERDHPPAPDSAGTGAPPPAARGSVPAPATGTKPPLDWQMKYAGVAADLSALGSTAHEASLDRRLNHFRTHLRMFYAAALGAPAR